MPLDNRGIQLGSLIGDKLKKLELRNARLQKHLAAIPERYKRLQEIMDYIHQVEALISGVRNIQDKANKKTIIDTLRTLHILFINWGKYYENLFLDQMELDSIESDDSVLYQLEILDTYIIATTNLVRSNQTPNDLSIFNSQIDLLPKSSETFMRVLYGAILVMAHVLVALALSCLICGSGFNPLLGFALSSNLSAYGYALGLPVGLILYGIGVGLLGEVEERVSFHITKPMHSLHGAFFKNSELSIDRCSQVQEAEGLLLNAAV